MPRKTRCFQARRRTPKCTCSVSVERLKAVFRVEADELDGRVLPLFIQINQGHSISPVDWTGDEQRWWCRVCSATLTGNEFNQQQGPVTTYLSEQKGVSNGAPCSSDPQAVCAS